MEANEGQPALIKDDKKAAGEEESSQEEEEEEYENKDVMILEGDEMEERCKEMREKMAALFSKTDGEFKEKVEEQKQLDKDFTQFMENEYADDQIGELEEDEINQEDEITKDALDEAMNEYIDSQKNRFRTLYKNFGEKGEKGEKGEDGEEVDGEQEEEEEGEEIQGMVPKLVPFMKH